MTTPNERLKARILEFRDKGMTWNAIAKLCGPDVNYQTIQNIVDKNTTPKEIIPISYGLGLTPESVWYGEDTRPESIHDSLVKLLLKSGPPKFELPYGPTEWEAWTAHAPEDVGTCYLDQDLRYININQRLAEINGLPIEDHIGKTIGDVLPGIAAVVAVTLRQVIETGKPVLEGSVVGETAAMPGMKRVFTHRFDPVIRGDNVIGVIGTVREGKTVST